MPERDFDPNSVRKSVNVNAAQEVAWRVFTERMEMWWPLAYYKIGKANAIDAVIEPHVGAAGMNRATMEAYANGAEYSRGTSQRA